ncbi:MAG: gamma-glutamylcyclotransferase family protein [Candidatus Binataceae bacterium]
MTEHARLFVYGSLIDESRRMELLGRQVESLRVTLKDYERGRARYYYIVKRPGIDTPGLVLFALTPGDFAALDRYEDVPRLYTRAKIEVVGEDGARLGCWVYLPTQRAITP